MSKNKQLRKQVRLAPVAPAQTDEPVKMLLIPQPLAQEVIDYLGEQKCKETMLMVLALLQLQAAPEVNGSKGRTEDPPPAPPAPPADSPASDPPPPADVIAKALDTAKAE